MASAHNLWLHAQGHVQRHLLANHVPLETWGRNANHGEAAVIQPNVVTDNRRRQSEFSFPIAVSQHNYRICIFGSIVRGGKQSACCSVEAAHRKIIPADHSSGDLFVSASALPNIDSDAMIAGSGTQAAKNRILIAELLI